MNISEVTQVENIAGSDEVLLGFKSAKFQVDSALLRELGERLVGQPHIALAELIKNSYDADATLCAVEIDKNKITVIDNGHGMTETEFLTHWMTIGTRNKQERGESRNFRRNVTGSKGVGRLSAQFLAHKLEILTVPKDKPTQQIRAVVDWDNAINAGNLTEAKVFYKTELRDSSFPNNKPSGTRVVMKDLKQTWDAETIQELGRQLWMIQSPITRYSVLKNEKLESDEFLIRMSSTIPILEDRFARQMTAALENYNAIISGELVRDGNKAHVHVKVVFRSGGTYSEGFSTDPLVDYAKWEIRVYKLVGRQAEGVTVQTAREYFERFGGVQVFDANFRLPYYGVEQDWLGIEYDHSHRRNKSNLLPKRLHVHRALNDLPTQGRLFGIVQIDTGSEARTASEGQKENGKFLKIQVTRDRLVANEPYCVLRDAVRWSLDYYATRQRLRVQQKHDIELPEMPSTDRIGSIQSLVMEARQSHPEDESLNELANKVDDLSATIYKERESEIAARSLLGTLASAGMAALALDHESRKEMRRARQLLRKLQIIAEEIGEPRIGDITDQVYAWVDRIEGTRKIFTPLLDSDDRDEIEALSAVNVLAQVAANVRPLIPGIELVIDIPSEIFFPPATFAEWNSVFQNILINAANATLDMEERRIQCVGGWTGRSTWIRIEDNGSGVDHENSSQLFEPFTRHLRISEERRALGLGGIGLGLTIVRMIATLRHVRVSFVKPSPGWSANIQLSWSSNK